MERFLLLLELAGTLAFAASGAMTGLEKNLDIFGVGILGLTTAVGGGVIRDLILGNTPPATFQDPIYATVAILTSLVLFLPRVRRLLMWDQTLFDTALFWMDTAGLGIFTVTGIRIAYAHAPRPTLFLLIFVGVVTGVGGGLLRDMMAGNTPYIFRKHVYASASLLGAVTCGLLWHYAGEMPSMLAGAGVVVLVRCLSAHFRWNLPRARGDGCGP
ncbi:trimeric intracellular cation channel family protein [uncultured Oscillibacter sp.]|uniref:trimeric intracellular cation channel family protein n=1 Tax=uncultured Oscillibacter sp. TaxID=876091 RepID=UPI0025D312DC|nr:TRIC cation channel family protein [uncultured Oscillibacter sp.]